MVLQFREIDFLEAYLVCDDVQMAILRSEIDPDDCHKLMKSKRWKDELRRRRELKAVGCNVTAQTVLEHTRDVVMSDALDVLNDDGSFKPLSDWPLIWRQMLSQFEVKELYDDDGANIGRLSKAKFVDKLKALEMLGKHTEVKAFAADVNHAHLHVTQEIADRLTSARNQVIDITPQTTTHSDDTLKLTE